MASSIIVAIDSASGAEHIAAWLPVLVTARFRRATLFHAVPEDSGAVSEELDALRPLLDKLAVALSANAVETDVAFKRGDVVKWLIALAELRHSELLVASLPVDGGAAPAWLERLCVEAPVPVLVLPASRPASGARLDAKPVLVLGSDEARVESLASDVIHANLIHADIAHVFDLPDASMLVMGPAPSGSRLADLLGGVSCPVLLFPSRSIGAPLGAN
jgi:hypothetical protein